MLPFRVQASRGDNEATRLLHGCRLSGRVAACCARSSRPCRWSGSRSHYSARIRRTDRGVSPRFERAGFVESRDVIIEYRWANDQYDRLQELAADLVSRRVAVIATIGGNAASVAARAATKTIPVVFHGSLDPIKAGFVASLNHPGGNATGVITLNVDTGRKRLELVHEVVPTVTTIGLLLNPTNKMVTEVQSKDLQTAARELGLQGPRAKCHHDFDNFVRRLPWKGKSR